MSVKCMNKYQKRYAVTLFEQKKMTQKELSKHFEVSERTINRVFIEAGVATPSERTKSEEYRITQLVNGYGLNFDSLNTLLRNEYAKQG